MVVLSCLLSIGVEPLKKRLLQFNVGCDVHCSWKGESNEVDVTDSPRDHRAEGKDHAAS
jgi:hypothetical protein